LFTSFIPMSDTIATAWCGGAFLAALRARRGRGWALACGVAFSIAVLVRPANVIMLPALILVLGNWRSLLWVGLGGLPGALVNGGYNHAMYGSALVSGYGESIFDVFGRVNFRPSLANYLETLPFALPVMFIGLLLLPLLPWRQRPREMGGVLLWALTFMLFYAFYEFTQQAWWFLRFLLPAFPALVILGICGLQGGLARLAERHRPVAGIIAATALVVLSVWGSVHVARERHLMLQKEYQQPYVAVCDWAREHLPAGTLVGSMQTSAAFYFYTDFPIMRWDQMNPDFFKLLMTALHQSGRPFYVVLFPFEESDGRLVPLHSLARWEKVADVKGVAIWKITPLP
jgi:4-amino-4-deoxy-L-arabinose transferase-like glycosyltransferase